MIISTSSCILLYKKESMTLFYRWRNRHRATQRLFRSYNSSRRQSSPALQVPLSPRQAGCSLQFSFGAAGSLQSAGTAPKCRGDSDLQRAVQCRALTLPGQDPPAEPRHPAHGWRRPGCCWSRSGGFEGGECLSTSKKEKGQASTPSKLKRGT